VAELAEARAAAEAAAVAKVQAALAAEAEAEAAQAAEAAAPAPTEAEIRQRAAAIAAEMAAAETPVTSVKAAGWRRAAGKRSADREWVRLDEPQLGGRRFGDRTSLDEDRMHVQGQT
jgi:hypothetical protein